MCDGDMEGIVAKKADGLYTPEETAWVKCRAAGVVRGTVVRRWHSPQLAVAPFYWRALYFRCTDIRAHAVPTASANDAMIVGRMDQEQRAIFVELRKRIDEVVRMTGQESVRTDAVELLEDCRALREQIERANSLDEIQQRLDEKHEDIRVQSRRAVKVLQALRDRNLAETNLKAACFAFYGIAADFLADDAKQLGEQLRNTGVDSDVSDVLDNLPVEKFMKDFFKHVAIADMMISNTKIDQLLTGVKRFGRWRRWKVVQRHAFRNIAFIGVLGLGVNMLTSGVQPYTVTGGLAVLGIAVVSHYWLEPKINRARIEFHRKQLLHLLDIYFQARMMTTLQLAFVQASVTGRRAKSAKRGKRE